MELNPNHRTTSEIRDQWHKIALLIMVKNGQDHVIITPGDIERMSTMFPGDAPAITISDQPEGIHIRVVSHTEGVRLAREAGGLPS